MKDQNVGAINRIDRSDKEYKNEGSAAVKTDTTEDFDSKVICPSKFQRYLIVSGWRSSGIK